MALCDGGGLGLPSGCVPCVPCLPMPANARQPSQTCPCTPLHALLALAGLGWGGPQAPAQRRVPECFSSFSSFSQASVAARPRTRGPASSQQSCSLKHAVPSYHDSDHFHAMSPFNPRPRFVRSSPCLPYSYGYYCHNHQTSALPSAPPAFYKQAQAFIIEIPRAVPRYARHVPTMQCRPG